MLVHALRLKGSAAGSAELAFQLPKKVLYGSLVLLVLALCCSVSLGMLDISVYQVFLELVDQLPFVSVDSDLSTTERVVLWQWRTPRAVLAALVGASLALSGATYQGVFRNPLADPYLLGVAAGAGLGATLAIVGRLNYGWGPFNTVQLCAFVGALGAVAISSLVGFGSSRTIATLLLAGVAVASFLTAVQTYVMHRHFDDLVEVYSWILGRIAPGGEDNGWSEVILLAPYLVGCGVPIFLLRRHLDLMRVGDEEATSLGLPVAKVRLGLIVAASILAAAAVAVSGLISFVGIVVPHIIRMAIGSSYRILIPMSAIGGAIFLVLADMGARNLVEGIEIPIGVVTAFFGAPLFVSILWRGKAVM